MMVNLVASSGDFYYGGCDDNTNNNNWVVSSGDYYDHCYGQDDDGDNEVCGQNFYPILTST